MQKFIFKDLGKIDYEEALTLQTSAFESLLEAKKQNIPGENILFFCEHNPVFTIGKSGNEGNLLFPESLLKQKGATLYHTNRGGDITYHGPGQITGYPVFDIEQWNLGLKQYIHRVEDVIIAFLELYGIKGERLENATGVWLEPLAEGRARKICAIGVKSSRYVTMHGFALNINTDLSYFSFINPCGFIDKGVTSLSEELGKEIDFEQVKSQLQKLFNKYFP